MNDPPGSTLTELYRKGLSAQAQLWPYLEVTEPEIVASIKYMLDLIPSTHFELNEYGQFSAVTSMSISSVTPLMLKKIADEFVVTANMLLCFTQFHQAVKSCREPFGYTYRVFGQCLTNYVSVCQEKLRQVAGMYHQWHAKYQHWTDQTLLSFYLHTRNVCKNITLIFSCFNNAILPSLWSLYRSQLTRQWTTR